MSNQIVIISTEMLSRITSLQRLQPVLSVICAIFIYNIGFAQDINLDIDWNNPVKAIPVHAYGVNSPANFIPSYSNENIFMANLGQITQKKGLIRLHGWGMIDESSPESWLLNGQWDSTKIQQALTPLVQQGYEVMINIPSGPMGEDDYQNPQQFAQFCADLVKIVNVDYQLNIKYWELPNEREADFISPGLSVAEMSTFIQMASQAMKNMDPTIKVGGPATAWINVDYLTQLVAATPEMDFITCHTYAGDCTNSLQEVYDNAQYAILDLSTLHQDINSITETYDFPIFLTEYNMSYMGCPSIQSYKGALYDALLMTQSIKSGNNATCYWNVAPYSDMSIINENVLEDNAYLYEVMNTHFYGEMVQNTTSDSTKVLVFATKNQLSNEYAICLINRTNAPQDISIQMNGITPGELTKNLWDTNNSYLSESTSWTQLNNGNFQLSPYSVTILYGPLDVVSVKQVETETQPQFYPNPTNGKLQIKNIAQGTEFDLFSPHGQWIKKGRTNGNEIDLSRYPAGVYFIRLFSNKKSPDITKIIKL